MQHFERACRKVKSEGFDPSKLTFDVVCHESVWHVSVTTDPRRFGGHRLYEFSPAGKLLRVAGGA